MLLLPLFSHGSVISPPASIVVLGPPGCASTSMLTAKLASQAGYATTLFTRDDYHDRCNLLMYGKDWAAVDDRVTLASTNSDFGRALHRADALVLVAETGGLTDLENTLRFAPNVRHIAYLTAIGGSIGRGGELGEAERILACEHETRAIASQAGAALSLVRVGALKGGGAAADGAIGLDPSEFYDTLRIGGYPTPSWQCAQDYDKFTLGATAARGDAAPIRGPGARSAARSSSAPHPDEVSRINAASALLACLRQPAPVEISLSARAATVAPTADEWDALLTESLTY